MSLGLAPAGDVHGVADGRPAARFPWFEPGARAAALAATLAARTAIAGRPAERAGPAAGRLRSEGGDAWL